MATTGAASSRQALEMNWEPGLLVPAGLLAADSALDSALTVESATERLRQVLSPAAMWRSAPLAEEDLDKPGLQRLGRVPRWRLPVIERTDELAAKVRSAWAAALPPPVWQWGHPVLRLQVDNCEDARRLQALDMIEHYRLVPVVAGHYMHFFYWRWPLRVAIAPGPYSASWLEQLAHSRYRELFEARIVDAAEEAPLDMLLVGPDGSSPNRATCAILVDASLASEELLARGRERFIGAAAIIGVQRPGLEWFDTLVEELAHDQPIDVALRFAVPNALISGEADFLAWTAARQWALEVRDELSRDSAGSDAQSRAGELRRLALNEGFDAERKGTTQLVRAIRSFESGGHRTVLERHLGAAAPRRPKQKSKPPASSRRPTTQVTARGEGRTTRRSSKGAKVYAVRNSRGNFKEPQVYRRASAIDTQRKSKKAMDTGPRRPAVRRAAKKKGGGGGGGGRARWVETAPQPARARPAALAPSPTARRRGSAAKSGKATTAQASRWIQARVFDLSAVEPQTPTPAFRENARHAISVIIAANQRGWLVARGRDASESIDSMLEPGTHELTVVLFIPELGVHRTGTLTLPPSGPTPRPVRFTFKTGKAGSTVNAFISIIHRGRVLQTAVLSGKAVSDPSLAGKADRIAIRLQIVVPTLAELDRRVPFDATLLMATRKGAKTVATGVTSRRDETTEAVSFKDKGIDLAGRAIRDILQEVVADDSVKGALESASVQGLLWRLAQEGRVLYEHIGTQLESALAGQDLERLQLVQADPSAFIPMEFAYALPAPANGARLCKNWRKALGGDPCPAGFHRTDELDHLKVVCPSGFWGVSKVIERQVFSDGGADGLANVDFRLRAEPSAARKVLPRIDGVVFAWSANLDNTVHDTSAVLLKKLERATGRRVDGVTTWLAWAKAIRAHQPELLVLLSHTIDGALEIGPENSGERATLAQINERYVRKNPDDAPIVLLLGCTTAVSDNAIQSFVARFRDRGAAVVVGTITPVLGERSAAVVDAVVRELARKRKQPALFGEVLRDARRKLLAKGEVTALCATSFGDASWYVP